MRAISFAIAACAVLMVMPACKSKQGKNNGGMPQAQGVEAFDFKASLKSLDKSERPVASALAKAFKNSSAARKEKAKLYTPVVTIEDHFCINADAVKSIRQSAEMVQELSEAFSKDINAKLEACSTDKACVDIGQISRAVLDVKAGIQTANAHTDAYQIGSEMGSSLDDINALIASAYDQIDDWLSAHDRPVDAAYDMDVAAFEQFSTFFERQAETANYQAWNGAPFADGVAEQLAKLSVEFDALQGFAAARVELEPNGPASYAAALSSSVIDILAQLDALSNSVTRAAQARSHCSDSLVFHVARANGWAADLDRTFLRCLESGVCHTGEGDIAPSSETDDSDAQPDLAERIDVAVQTMHSALQ